MKKVLLAEDDLSTRKIIGRALEHAGYIVVLASDGQRALSILQDNHDFSLLITDMQMPNMDGRELIRQVGSSCANYNIPIIIVSGIISLGGITDLLDNGASRFIPKPVDIKELLRYAADLTRDDSDWPSI